MMTDLQSDAGLQARRLVAAAFSVALLALGVILVVWRETLVPEKMTFDSQFIQTIAQGKVVLGSEDKSYGNIGRLYQFLGLGYQPFIASMLGFAIYFILLSGVSHRLAEYRVSILDRLVLVAAAGLGGIFLAQYSKDVIVAMLVALAFYLGRSWISELFFVACALAYATAFRQYWYLIIALYVVLRLVHARWRKLWPLLLVCLAFLAMLAFALPLVAHVDIQSFRLQANADRVGSENAQSMIMPFLEGESIVIGAANTLISFVQLLLPVPMLLLSAQHAVYGLFLITLWSLFLWGVHRGSGLRDLPIAWERGCSLALAMVSIQAVFEPDYGSYLRHLTPLLPLLLFVGVVSRHRPEGTGPRA